MHGAQALSVRFKLREILEAADISQSELSRRSGVSLVTVNAICVNSTRQVRLDTLNSIANALRELGVKDVGPGDLLEWTPDPGGGRKRGRAA